jgi:hypothetical protein
MGRLGPQIYADEHRWGGWAHRFTQMNTDNGGDGWPAVHTLQSVTRRGFRPCEDLIASGKLRGIIQLRELPACSITSMVWVAHLG